MMTMCMSVFHQSKMQRIHFNVPKNCLLSLHWLREMTMFSWLTPDNFELFTSLNNQIQRQRRWK